MEVAEGDGDPLAFRWSLLSRPDGSAAVLSDPSAVAPLFVVDVAGTYVAQLIVNDGLQDSEPDTVTITTENSRPTADAGPDQQAARGATVVLDGSGSSDPDGTPLAFAAGSLSESLLFGVTGRDLPTYLLAMMMLAVSAVWASWLPARRAASVNPIVALRSE